jgi:hypothetical protein
MVSMVDVDGTCLRFCRAFAYRTELLVRKPGIPQVRPSETPRLDYPVRQLDRRATIRPDRGLVGRHIRRYGQPTRRATSTLVWQWGKSRHRKESDKARLYVSVQPGESGDPGAGAAVHRQASVRVDAIPLTPDSHTWGSPASAGEHRTGGA